MKKALCILLTLLTIVVLVQMTALASEYIREVHVIDVIPPVAGQTFDEEAHVYSTSNYSVAGQIEWYDETDNRFLEKGDKFEVGHIYTVQVRLDVSSGYEFDASATAYNMDGYINGEKAKLAKDFEYQRWARVVVTYTFPKVENNKKITSVSVTDIVEPKIGKQSIARPHYLKYSEGVTGVAAWWHENYASGGFSPDSFKGVFAEKKGYTFEVVMKAQTGYEFALKADGTPDVAVTFNSRSVDNVKLDGEGRLVAIFDYGNLGADKERIKGGIVYYITSPAIGEKPSFEAENQRENEGVFSIDTSNENFTKNGITWYERIGDQNTKMDENDTFKAGGIYYVAIRVKPKDGYLFEVDSNGDLLVLGSINGYDAIIEGNEESLFVAYTFKALESPEIERPVEEEKSPFNDVVKGEYYYDAVLWASKEGITGGTTANTFSPNAFCTRAQVVTFLWRMTGSPWPAAIAMPFADVAKDAYYYDPVKWALGSTITGGTSENTFSPNVSCTRAQVVTFLWRCTGCPEPELAGTQFKDLNGNSYYYKAVLWAVENGITGGTSTTTFSPDTSCTRAQVVTFLYRFMNRK